MDTNLNESENIDKTVDYTDFEEKFFKEVRDGKDWQHFLNVSSQSDCMLIRSILSSMEIPTYTEGEHINKIYGGMSTCLTNVFKIKVYILVDDYDEAITIVKDYIKNKINSLSSRQGKDTYIKALEILAAPYIISTSQEMLGISIMCKKNCEEKRKKRSKKNSVF